MKALYSSVPIAIVAASVLAACGGRLFGDTQGQPPADAGPPAPDAAEPSTLTWECGDAVAVYTDSKGSPYPVANAVGSGWCRVPFAPPDSKERIAFRDNMPVAMPAWGPCDGNPMPGCRRIDAKSWTTYEDPFWVSVRADEAGVARMKFQQSFLQPFDPDVAWTDYEFFGELDKPAEFVTFHTSGGGNLSKGVVLSLASSFGALIDVLPKGEENCEREFLFASAPRKDAFKRLMSHPGSCDPNNVWLRRTSVNQGYLMPGGALLLAWGAGTGVVRLDTASGEAIDAQVNGRVIGAGGEADAAPGGSVISLNQPPRYPIAFLDGKTNDGQIIIMPPAGRMSIPMGLDWSTTPPTLVWVEGIDGGLSLSDVDVYASPFSPTAAGITRRKVTHIPDAVWGAGIVNAGYYATGTDDPHTNWIIRLSDGARWPFTLTNGRDAGAFWITKDELLYRTGDYQRWKASGLSEGALQSFTDGLERASITELLQTTPLPRLP